MNKEITKSKKDGTNLFKGLLTLKWKYCAHIIKNAIKIEEKNNKSSYHIPKTIIVDSDIFTAPIKCCVRAIIGVTRCI